MVRSCCGFALLLSMLCLGMASPALAATYYVAANGLDTNNGTAKTTPWAHSPGMANCTGNCAAHTPVAGDQFIFRGGDTWSSTSLPWNWKWSGNSSQIIYVGVDQAWYSSSSWTQPSLNNNYQNLNNILQIATVQYVQFDNFDIQGFVANGMDFTGSVVVAGATNTTLSFLHVHRWNHCSAAGVPAAACTGLATDSQDLGGIVNNPLGNNVALTNYIIDHCDIGSPDGDPTGGDAIYFAGELRFSKIHDAAGGMTHGGYSVHDNEFYNINPSYSTGPVHSNMTFIDLWDGRPSGDLTVRHPAYFYNNLLHDVTQLAVQILYPNPGSSGQTSPAIQQYIYNNLVYNVPTRTTLEVDTYGAGSGLQMNLYVWNNTIENAGGNNLVRVVTGSGRLPVNIISVQGNHWISDNSSYTDVSSSSESLSPTVSNNIAMTHAQATANGYTLNNSYAPSSGSSATVGAGLNFTTQGINSLDLDRMSVARPGGTNPWDAGAYFFGSSTKPNPPTGLVAIVQ